MRTKTTRRVPFLGLIAIAFLLVTSCSTIGTEDRGSQATTTTVAPVEVTAVPAADAKDVPLDKPVTISVKAGTIVSVAITSPAGPLEGALAPESTSWESTGPLTPATTYSVVAQLADANGGTSDRQWSFTTGAPSAVFKAPVGPDGRAVGVGMPVIMKTSHPVSPATRAEFLKHVTVATTPAVAGAWHWFSNSELHWRPATYWTPGTKVTVTVKLAGYNYGGGIWGVKDVVTNFSIGDSHISVVDTATHQMAVTVNGAVVKMIPVSTGRDKYPTKGGVHVVSDKQQKVTMDSATVGIPRDSPDGYLEDVFWNVRISNSGEFVHAAPWSTGSQGAANVSHGCVNVSDADGQWFYNFSQVGDVVDVRNSPEQLSPTNGIGDWQIPWAQWPN